MFDFLAISCMICAETKVAPEKSATLTDLSQPLIRATMKEVVMTTEEKTLTKRCPHCDTDKPLEDFHYAKKGVFGRAAYCKMCSAKYMRSWRPLNRDKCRKGSKRWADKNREKLRLVSQKWREAHREQDRANAKNWKANNRERHNATERKWCKANKDKCNASALRWRNKNRPKMREKYRRSDARRRSAEGSWTTPQWLTLCAKYGNKCLRCERTDRPLTPDHVIPIFLGGTNWLWNIQPLCRNCNSSKGIRTDDYRYSRRFDLIAQGGN